MTIASEIERLQLAKNNIRSSIENKWIIVPQSTKLDWYPSLIDSIETWISQETYDELLNQYNELLLKHNAEWIFLPASLTIIDFVRNKDNGVYVTADVWDIIKSDSSVYYHYFWISNSSTTAYDWWNFCCFYKTPWNNPWVVLSSELPEQNHYYYGVNLNIASRMKIDGNNIKVSSLCVRQYDSNWWNVSWWNYTSTFICANATNTSVQLVTLWTIDWYHSIPTEEILATWTESCWITAEESVESLWLTTISTTYGSDSNYYNLVATINS